MRILEIHSNLIVVNINYILLPTRSDSRNTILCKMSAERIQHGRTRWTEQKDEAKQLHTSEECLTNEKGRKTAIMQLTWKVWNEKEYGNLGKTTLLWLLVMTHKFIIQKLIYDSELAVKFKRLNTLYMNILIRILK